MDTLRKRLLLALGAAVTGCQDEEEVYQHPDAFFGPYAVADSGLPVFPLARVQCPKDTGYPVPGCAPCCETFACYVPEADERCVDAVALSSWDEAYALLARLEVYPHELCRIDGPFDPQAAGQASGACCYVAGTLTCSGRPLIVAGALRVSPLARRADWS